MAPARISGRMLKWKRVDLLLKAVAKLCHQPDVFPSSDGGIQLEWHIRGLDAEISIAADAGLPEVYFHDSQERPRVGAAAL